jgi:hypothetical protein
VRGLRRPLADPGALCGLPGAAAGAEGGVTDRPSVYVAASSDELGRAAIAMLAVRNEGWRVAEDWVATIREVGVANPADASQAARAGWSRDALEGVRFAQAVWLLAPEVGHARGAFVEFGYALALGRPVIVSGRRHACSIFTALATEVELDSEAIAVMRGWWAP